MSSNLAPANSTATTRVIRNAICTFCGCLCDDIHLTVVGEGRDARITHAENACPLGQVWFGQFATPQPVGPIASIQGRDASLSEAVDAAAHLLVNACSPLIYGLNATTCETQAQATALADFVAANLDTPTSTSQGPSGSAFLKVGESGAMFGEIRNRADLVIYWGSNPEVSQPRHMSRHILPAGLQVPNGRADRTIVVIDVERTPTADQADLFLQVKPDSDFDLIWALRALLKGKTVGADIEAATGVPLATLQALVTRMKQCHFGVFLYGAGLTATRGRHFNLGALQALTTELNDHAHFVARALRAGGNPTGADNVLTWQTSYPFAVNFGNGFPRFNPGEFSASEVLSRGETDAVVIVASDPARYLSKAALEQLAQIPHIVIGPNPTAISSAARVAFTTATYGIHTPGTVYRSDGVTLELRPALPSPYPSDEAVLRAIQDRVVEVRRPNIPRRD